MISIVKQTNFVSVVLKKLLGQQDGNSLRHVDGLRAIAILSVLVYHFKNQLLPGGFVGVDVFFVISGYLISTRIIGDLEKGSFSFSQFYLRRVKRILPVYLAVIVFVIVLLPFLYSVAESKSIVFTAEFSLLFSANIYFSNFLSYFDVSSKSNPFLHLWSLSVEEQFYLTIPLLLFLLFKINKKSIVVGLVVLTMISFSVSVAALVYGRHDFAFYQLPSRAWELLVGGVLGQFPRRDGQRGLASLLTWIGMLVLLCSLVLLNEKLPFPGLLALPPVIGAVLIIRYGDNAIGVTKWISGDLAVLIGKLSYSLYIWHWPIFVFALISGLPHGLSIAFVLVFPIAFISWRFFENPIRYSKILTKNTTFGLLLALEVLIFGVCLSFSLVQGRNGNGGLPLSWNGTATYITKETPGHPQRESTDLVHLVMEDKEVLIKIGSLDRVPSFFLWGDSTALALLPGVDRYASMNSSAGLYLNLKQGLTLNRDIGPSSIFSPEKDREPVLKWLESRPDIKGVLLVNTWIYGKIRNRIDIDEVIRICRRLKKAGKNVYFFTSLPSPNMKTLRLLDWGFFGSAEVSVASEIYERNSGLQGILIKELEAEKIATVIHCESAFIENGRHLVVSAGKSLFLDATHVTGLGADIIMKYAAPEIWKN